MFVHNVSGQSGGRPQQGSSARSWDAASGTVKPEVMTMNRTSERLASRLPKCRVTTQPGAGPGVR
jgi:hypothetical protein